MRPFSTLGRWLGVLALAACVATPALAQRNVTLRMNSATMPDTVKADMSAGVQVRGNIGDGSDGADALPGGDTIDWSDATTLKPTNVGGDYWEIDFQIPDNTQLDFKFYISQSEGANLPGGYEEGGNHTIAAGTGDVVRDLHYFEKVAGDQAYDWRPFSAPGDSVAVWFRVYMDTENAVGAKKYTADDGELVVSLRGNFGERNAVGSEGEMVDWDGTDARLTRESDDAAAPGYALFSGLVKFPGSEAGNDVNYKFYFNDSDVSGDAGYEDGGNRSFTIPAASSDTTLHWQFFSNSPANDGSLVTSNVLFEVDVSPLTSLGIFETGEDVVQVRGGFNGWDCPDDAQDDCLLEQAPGTANFLREVPISSAPNSELNYKFYVNFLDAEGNPQFEDAAGDAIDVGWEEPLDFGGGDRTFTFAGSSEQSLDKQFFNSVRPGNLIPAGQTIDLTFTADMNDAKTFADAQGRAFDAGKDTVTVQFEDLVWLLTQGYTPGGEGITDSGDGYVVNGFKLTDPDGDGVYSGTLSVNGDSYNGIGYKLAFGNDDDGLQVEGAGGFDEGRRRYRYITDVNASAFSFGTDTFRSSDSNTPALSNMPWEVNPTGTFTPDQFRFAVPNGYNDQGNAVSTPTAPTGGELALGNVYPNPTTGTARVVVSGRADARVSVRVYDVTGRVVATVAEDVAIDGRPLEFDVSGLASGLYLVRADSGSGVATQRLTVVR